MKMEEKDILREMFRDLPDERLPDGFNETVMSLVGKEVARREKAGRLQETLCYVAAGISILSGLAVVLFMLDFSFSNLHMPKVDLSGFESSSLPFSIYIGSIALLLLVADTLIRHHISKKKLMK